MGRLRILRVDSIPGTPRCGIVLMVLEGVLEAGTAIECGSHFLRVLAMAGPGYKRRQNDTISPGDLLDSAREGETVEALVDMALFDSPLADLLYHDLEFQ